jgi:hypothetical protein
MIAALYVEPGGPYFGVEGVDPWDVARDARLYAGPWPVVAHPPCERWGRFWHGSPRNPHQFKLGDDGGCFAAALTAVRRFGGVLEHPADSHAFKAFGLNVPPRSGGWVAADSLGGAACYVEQGFYGHAARKPTWLYAFGVKLPELRWGRGAQRLHPGLVAKYGYAYARRQGVVSLIGGKDKKAKRNASPLPFRDVLIAMATSGGMTMENASRWIVVAPDGKHISLGRTYDPHQIDLAEEALRDKQLVGWLASVQGDYYARYEIAVKMVQPLAGAVADDWPAALAAFQARRMLTINLA